MTQFLLELAGYIALLLWGMRMVRLGVVRAYGTPLRGALGQAMGNRLAGWAAGLGVTTLLQSSTATALLMASFAGAGLLELAPALAIMLGADVGSSLVVQFASLDLTWLPALLLLTGSATYAFGRDTRQRDLAEALVGLGVMLLALHLIVAGSASFRDSPGLHRLLTSLSGTPMASVLFGAALTALTHSSLAVLLLIMSLARHVLPLPVALALALGANMGSAFPAVMDTSRANAAARRVPLGNLLFRLAGVAVAIPLLPWAVWFVTHVESGASRQVADFHTAFNLGLSVLCIGLTDPAAWLLQRLLPRRGAGHDPAQPRYLDDAEDTLPATALAAAQRESLRLADTVEQMLRETLDVFRRDDRSLGERIESRDDIVDRLHAEIKFYLTRLDPDDLGGHERQRLDDTLNFITNLAHVGDIIDKNLMQTARKKINNHQRFSAAGWHEISDLHEKLLRSFKLCVNAFVSENPAVARALVDAKHEFRSLERKASTNHIQRLQHHTPASMETSSLHLDILRDLKRINSHLSAVAYPILERRREASGHSQRKDRHRCP